MSDEGERTCPLCAEEMDLTDQQLKPCKCGYEICVWCWHHILEMAEKDDTEGRCPACRSPYDKEKIVGMAANCERLVAETNMERKMKNQKAKSKLSEGRKQLSSVRVIQRNLVYIVGLPLNLADEDLLHRREYFGQYGKVLKVSMSRTAAGVIQQFPNSTCSVYITYSKEEEAIRCIQSVHGFVLEGKPLRACFGTTKYCHAWLRNVPCSNPDCLYLHEIGSQEDSFTKDEIISAYTSRVQQITGAANNMQEHSGSVLPPPLDDYINSSSGKPIAKNVSNNPSSTLRGSPPNGSSGRSITLPAAAAWMKLCNFSHKLFLFDLPRGTRTTSCQPPSGGLLCPNGPSKPKPDTASSTLAFSSAVAGTIQPSALHGNETKRPTSSDGSHIMLPSPRVKNELLNPVKQYNSMDHLNNGGEKTALSNVSSSPANLSSQLSSQPSSINNDRGSCAISNTTNCTNTTMQSCWSGPEEAVIATNEEIQNLCSDLSSVNINRDVQSEQNGINKPSSQPSDSVTVNSSPSHGSQNKADNFRDSLTTVASKAATSENGVCISREQCDWRLDSQNQLVSDTTEVEDDITSFDNQRLKDPEVCRSPYLPRSASFVNVSNHSSPRLLQLGEPCTTINAGSHSAADKVGDSLLHATNLFCNGYPEKLVGSSSYGLSNERNEQCIGNRFSSEAINARNDAMDKGESSIISNILSMDFDPWDDSLTSPQNLAKLLGDNNDNQCHPLKNSWKVQNNQSRFSFARQEEAKFRTFDVHPSYGVGEQLSKSCSLIQDFAERDLYLNRLGIGNGFSTGNLEESDNLGNGHFVTSNKLSAVSRAQITAPPGFSAPSRAPPPGFSLHERVEQAFDPISGNSLLESSSLLRNSYQMPTTGNIGGPGDIEFNDPAILAVGKGRLEGALNSSGLDLRSNFAPQLNYFENEARLQLLMQQSLSQQPNHRFSENGNAFSQFGDSYGLSARLDQSQVSNLVPFSQLSPQQSRNVVLSNGQWDGWSEIQSGNSMGVAELLRNERFGLNKFYAGYEDSKYRMQNTGDLYNRTFGM
ncbi:CCR4-NOT transcription complex subunit 4 [Senna tora]|uniref:CCR4-NOT transcription complex subunit 4 n=1 Tax=Senna tora TaxID=362788 RepID=A0A834WHE5_9FABA|nr:CCR4-NOT transcription complex subunit 4 [Senna tora]